ncbi:MAG: DUF3179 domain-containing protein [Chloroflexi bacterium]|nr:DUF3179 domain-containing protein [Chloroflexota bacterium]
MADARRLRSTVRRRARAATLLAAAIALVALAACGGDEPPEAAVTPAATAQASPTVTAQTTTSPSPAAAITTPTGTPTPPGREFEDDELNTARSLERNFPRLDLSRRAVSLAEIRPVIPRDAIPSIDEPRFLTLDEASDWLSAESPVIAFQHNGEARAYPLQILTWHEIVNDVVGGEPVIITYCPLCNSAIAFSRLVNGEERTFGVSGTLRRSDLIMYDRETQTLWQQLTGEAIVGRDTGVVLEFLPAQLVSFEEFRAAFEDGVVLSRETGHSRNYGENPYVLYDSRDGTLFPVGEFSDQLSAKERVLTLELGGETAAFPFSALSRLVVIEAEVGGEQVVAFWQPGQVSALDDAFIVGSRNVGSAGAFSPFLDGERLRFEAREGAIVDIATGSTWDVLGRAVGGPLAGAQLTPLVSGNHFWFAWAVFQPETRVILGSDGDRS